MAEKLAAARSLAEQVRFSGDVRRLQSEGDATTAERVRSWLLQSELQIAPAVTPELAGRLGRVFERLHIPSGTVQAFVYSSPEVQAQCFTGTTSECVIRFSSALISLLDEEDFEFVVGHELGHFLLGHGVSDAEGKSDNVEYFLQQRGKEISADRIGLIACPSLHIAIRALMKTVSGLSDRYLRFDVGEFVAQLRNVSTTIHSSETETHPSILIRCRALLWFSTSDFIGRGASHFSEEQMAKLNGLVQDDLKKFVDGHIHRRIEEAKENLAIWMAAYHAVQDGVFTKVEQSAIAELFDEDLLERLRNYLSDIPTSEAESAVYERMREAREELVRMIPTGFESEFADIEARISSQFRRP